MIKSFKICAAIAVIMLASTAWSETPKRIVSLKPSITDTVYALGLGERLVGVTRYCDIPDGSARPKIVGDYTRPYLERIVALSPEMVLGSMENSSRRSIEGLRRMGLHVELFDFGTIAETMRSTEAIAASLGERERGEALALRMSVELAALKARYAGEKPKRVVVVWGVRPIVAAGPGSYMDEGLGYAGAVNALSDSKVKYPRIGLEELIAMAPDVIVDLSMGSEAKGEPERPWDRTDAIGARVVRMNADDFRAGPRLTGGLRKLGEEIHSR